MSKKDSVFAELKILADQSREDFLKKQHVGFRTYMDNFNRLLEESKKLNVNTDGIELTQMNDDPDLPYQGQLLATINEVTLKAKQLLIRFQEL